MPAFYPSPSINTQAQNKKVVDTTGAGNAFLGGFSIGLHETGDEIEAAMYGIVAASLVCEQIGVPILTNTNIYHPSFNDDPNRSDRSTNNNNPSKPKTSNGLRLEAGKEGKLGKMEKIDTDGGNNWLKWVRWEEVVKEIREVKGLFGRRKRDTEQCGEERWNGVQVRERLREYKERIQSELEKEIGDGDLGFGGLGV